LDLAYDGGQFAGWAPQPGQRTVCGELTAAVSRVLQVAGIRIVVAGRTDAGVHALGQVCHLDLPGEAWPGGSAATRRLNAVLPADILVLDAQVAPAGFDARFSAQYRRYEYLISDSGRHDPRARSSVLIHRRTLDVPSMHAAGQVLRGEHDFAAFCRARPEASSVRTVLGVTVDRRPDPRDPALIGVQISADAFCHSMVRSVVGALIAVGEGRITAGELADILQAARRVSGFTTVPAHGLALVEVGYPADRDLADQARRARRFRG
jgi:tRNA pseudouridine38-40 synthase